MTTYIIKNSETNEIVTLSDENVKFILSASYHANFEFSRLWPKTDTLVDPQVFFRLWSQNPGSFYDQVIISTDGQDVVYNLKGPVVLEYCLREYSIKIDETDSSGLGTQSETILNCEQLILKDII